MSDCACMPPVQQDFWKKYKKFLLSRNTILTFSGALLLVIGALLAILGKSQASQWVFLASALTGGTPLFLFSMKGLLVNHDITAGVMASTAMAASIIVGEYIAAALVVFMFSVGEWLEEMTMARANNALAELAQMIPSMVTVRRKDQEITIPIDNVRMDDIVLVRTGERIATDGVVLKGNGAINQAAITGESMPVDKQEGDNVYAGTLNELGTLEIKISRMGDETTMGQIVTLVKEAQATQAPVQRLANRIARILVPITFSIAILVFLLTGEIMRGVTVLVVVCPCALVLATPTAVVAAIGNAARRGMLVKTGASIEQVGSVDVVAFDKTGTLTYGTPVVQDVISLNGVNPDRLLNLAASAEWYSEHPIGRSIVKAAQEKSNHLAGPVDFEVLPGFGVTARIDNQKVTLGKRSLLLEQQVAWEDRFEEKMKKLEDEGKTVIAVAIDNQVHGLIALADTPRETAKQAIAELKSLGIKKVVMITGDNPRTARLVAEKLGVDQYFAEVLPKEKLDIIRNFQAKGLKVAFAGDGVNDAPALAAADIGIAMGTAGTDVAFETAEIGLMQDEIQGVPHIISLSRRTLKVVRQNVIFSMSMNVLSVILSGFGIIGPVAGALMHEFSALPVLANSARLVGSRKNPGN